MAARLIPDIDSYADAFAMGAYALAAAPEAGLAVSTDAIRRGPAELNQTMWTLASMAGGDAIFQIGAGEVQADAAVRLEALRGPRRLEDQFKLFHAFWESKEPVDFEGNVWTMRRAWLGKARVKRPQMWALGGARSCSTSRPATPTGSPRSRRACTTRRRGSASTSPAEAGPRAQGSRPGGIRLRPVVHERDPRGPRRDRPRLRRRDHEMDGGELRPAGQRPLGAARDDLGVSRMTGTTRSSCVRSTSPRRSRPMSWIARTPRAMGRCLVLARNPRASRRRHAGLRRRGLHVRQRVRRAADLLEPEDALERDRPQHRRVPAP